MNRVRAGARVAALVWLAALVVGCGGRPSMPDAPERLEDEPTWIEAVERARTRWPEFLDAFANQRRGKFFQVKHGFETDAGGTVYVWIRVATIARGSITGVIVDTPEFDIGKRDGDRVSIKEADIVDWLYYDFDGNVTGDFTTDVYNKILAKRRR